GNAGLSIIFLSLAVNFLVLPLYKRADELQAEERDIQVKMAPMIKHIKSTFKGDERFMMLQEYYKINHYKPVYALKSTASLLLQIPFFIAAYNLLSGMQSLQGMQFGPIADLGKEDAMFMIGSFPVNVLPILMTLINIASGIIYTKGHPVKEKIQVYGLAAVFLVLLYRSPSGLVFYWLLNNVFSLVKNVFYKLKDPKKALNIVLAIAGAVILVLTLIRTDLDNRQKFLLAAGCILLALPLVSGLIKPGKKAEVKEYASDKGIFIAGAVFMAMLTGFLIPTTIINASSLEFIDATHLANPVLYIVNSMLLSFGSFVLWGGVFYFFMNSKMKSYFCKGIWALCGISILDYMLFGTKLGILSSTLQYENKPVFAVSEYVLNAVAVIAVAALFCFIYSKFRQIAKFVIIIGILTIFGIGSMSFVEIWGSYSWFQQFIAPASETLVLPFSTEGKNVVVVMLDRLTGPFLPYIFNEKPELKEKFDGFTYYPNTIAYGPYTLFGSPALYGGYEYTPERINSRDTELLVDKHNEALKVMPVLFDKNGFDVTVCDASFAGYSWIPDLTVFDAYPDIHNYNTAGRFNYFEDIDSSEEILNASIRTDEIRNRNFFVHSLMKVSPVLLQETIYNNGSYNASFSGSAGAGLTGSDVFQTLYSRTSSYGYRFDFLQEYSVLNNLPNITAVNESSDDTFLMMCNETSHNACFLQEPDYVPSIYVDNSAYDTDMVSRYTVDGVTMDMTQIKQIGYYHVGMATYLKLGEWFDYLRENGVYDNTRIILVADHGEGLGQFGLTCRDQDMEFYLPILLVKDFDAHGFNVCEDFMTNGDTAVIATDGLIDDPINPFTQNPINSDAKAGTQTVFYSEYWSPSEHEGHTTFLPGSWYSLDGDPYDAENWKYLGDW
ncbi:MAG: YidC/Oxa1 family membrane protein insertase, partial [Saccharofermentans sp.]|nr:YidC/Oxa1 family membrane protein insertase [Saccharofermentans sp.]